MKKFTLIIVTAALIAGLTGCNKTGNSESSNDSTSTSSQTNAAESTESAESTDSADSEPELSDDVKKLLEKFPKVAEYTGLDGNVMPLDRIKNIEFSEEFTTTVTYDLGYMTYGLPVFATTLDNDDWKSDGDGFSNAIDWLSYRRDEAEKSFAGHDFFMVKPGDKLENGLVVKTAEQICNTFTPEDEKYHEEMGTPLNILSSSKIEFDGTLTLEGILYKYAYDEDYNAAPNDVFFYPNTTKNEFVPMCQNMPPETALFDSNNAVIYDGWWYYLGNLDGYGDLPSVDYDVDEILGDKNYARVKITLKDICVGSMGRDSQSPQRAKIADVERLD